MLAHLCPQTNILRLIKFYMCPLAYLLLASLCFPFDRVHFAYHQHVLTLQIPNRHLHHTFLSRLVFLQKAEQTSLNPLYHCKMQQLFSSCMGRFQSNFLHSQTMSFWINHLNIPESSHYHPK